jgi:hypothetical protein
MQVTTEIMVDDASLANSAQAMEANEPPETPEHVEAQRKVEQLAERLAYMLLVGAGGQILVLWGWTQALAQGGLPGFHPLVIAGYSAVFMSFFVSLPAFWSLMVGRGRRAARKVGLSRLFDVLMVLAVVYMVLRYFGPGYEAWSTIVVLSAFLSVQIVLGWALFRWVVLNDRERRAKA